MSTVLSDRTGSPNGAIASRSPPQPSNVGISAPSSSTTQTPLRQRIRDALVTIIWRQRASATTDLSTVHRPHIGWAPTPKQRLKLDPVLEHQVVAIGVGETIPAVGKEGRQPGRSVVDCGAGMGS